MRYVDPVLLNARQAVERSRADWDRQKKRLQQVWDTTSDVQCSIERTQRLLREIEAALHRFNSVH
jgi:septal ring factor EnvC (AmiA/AmiB activator)